MDFDSVLSAELSKPKPSKVARRADIEAERRAAYEAEQKALEEKRAARAAAKRKAEEEAEEEKKAREEKRRRLAEESRRRREEEEREEERRRRKRLGLPELKEEEAAGEEPLGENEEDIPEEELVQKLRTLGEPAVLFGEGHAERVRRYRRLGMVVTKGPVPTTLELVDEKDMKVDGTVPEDKEGRKYLYRQLASYFTLVLTEYEKAMEKEAKDTMASRTAYNAMVQTRENMKPVRISLKYPAATGFPGPGAPPFSSLLRGTQKKLTGPPPPQLFRRFERDDLDPALLRPITEIVQAAQERRYVDANDGYLRLSIGKAAWPIGVTMVGIHERSAREKLHTGEKGHVMGDEVTRKFLQSIKRMITFAQVRWPPSDITQLMG